MTNILKRMLALVIAVMMLAALPFGAAAKSSRTPSSQERTTLLGDVDNNGSVTMTDAILVLRYVLGISEINGPCDMNGDGVITSSDALIILRQALGMMDLIYLDTFDLRASRTIVLIDGGDTSIYFYLETDMNASVIPLKWAAESGEVIGTAEMRDNGTGADDIAGDGIYSVRVTPNVHQDAVLRFSAEYQGRFSNVVEVSFYAPITDDTLAAMEVVDNAIGDLVDDEEFYDMPVDDRLDSALELLENLEEVGMIEAGSIDPDEANCVVNFTYLDDIYGSIMYAEFNSDMNGGREGGGASVGAEGVPVETLDENDLSIRAIILNSFPVFENDPIMIDYRTTFYENLRTEWNNAGMNTTLIVNPTVDTYKNIDEYEAVCISTHGVLSNRSPAILLGEVASIVKDLHYYSELKDHQIGKFNGYYCIYPRFFTVQFSENDLADSFVFSECCMSLGKGNGSNGNNYNYSMANAFLGRGAKAYVGYHNSVFADYSRGMMRIFFNELLDGKTSGQAFNAAVALFGANHQVWFENTHSYSLQYFIEHVQDHPETFNPLVHVAYPVRMGDVNATLLNNGLLNGSFEDYDAVTSSPDNWQSFGDVRTLTRLGDITPAHLSRMAIVTSGIGAQSSGVFENGTEGSMMYQTFVVPQNVSTITIRYNFVSEEPMEWVGSEYDDAFVIRFYQAGEIFYEEVHESINSSTWYDAPGVNFNGGDNTAFQTGWKTVTFNISALRGQALTLGLVIYDVGDQIYDSAVLVDGITLD